MAEGRQKSPAFSMYPKDYLASEDITLMPPEAEGLYNRCLMLAWDNRGLPPDPADVLKLVGTKYVPCWKTAWPPVRKKFYEKDGRLWNKRQEQERDKQTQRATKARESANARWEHRPLDANASATHMLGKSPEHSLAVAVAVASPSAKPKPSADAGGWTVAFGKAWHERFQGTVAYGRIGRALLGLRATYTDREILERWKRFLAQAKPGISTPEGFAQTFGDWGPDGSSTKPRGPQYQTADEADRKAGILP